MPGLLKKPTVVTVPGGKNLPHYSVSFTYEYEGTPVTTNQNIGGLAYSGNLYTFNALDIVTSASLPQFRSMQFSITFFNDDTAGADIDGELIVYVPASGQIIRIGCPFVDSTNGYYGLVSGVVPIIANIGTTIQFAKAANANTLGLMHGVLTVNLFDFDVAPYVYTGFNATE